MENPLLCKTTEYDNEMDNGSYGIASQKIRANKPKSPGHSIESNSGFRNSIPNYNKDPVELAQREKEQTGKMNKSGSSKKNKILHTGSEKQDDSLKTNNFQNSKIIEQMDQQPTVYGKGFVGEQDDATKKTKGKTTKKRQTEKSDQVPIVRTDPDKFNSTNSPNNAIKIQDSHMQNNESIKKSKNQQLDEKSYFDHKDMMLNT